MAVVRPAIHFMRMLRVPSTQSLTCRRRCFSNQSRLAAYTLWTDEANQHLLELKDQGKSWREILPQFPGTAIPTLKTRWYHLRHPSKRSHSPPSSRRRWTAEEDQVLTTARESGSSYDECTRQLEGRNHESVAFRWRNILQPRNTLNIGSRRKQPMSAQQIEQIRHMREEESVPWKDIAKYMQRTFSVVRHAYYSNTNSTTRPKHNNLTHWKPTDVAKAAELYGAGRTVDQIARELKRTPIAVSERLRWPHNPYALRTSEENVVLGEQVAAYRREGVPWTAIAGHFPAISLRTLQRYCKDVSIPSEVGAPTRKLDKRTVKSLVRMKDMQQLSFDDIAAELGHSHLAVRSAYDKHKASALRQRIDTETIQDIVHMRDVEQLPFDKIAFKLSRSISTVQKAYHKHGEKEPNVRGSSPYDSVSGMGPVRRYARTLRTSRLKRPS